MCNGDSNSSPSGTRVLATGRPTGAVAGRVFLVDRTGWLPSSHENQVHPLREVAVALFVTGNLQRPIVDGTTNTEGYFAFQTNQLQGNDPSSLTLGVFSDMERRAFVVHGTSQSPHFFLVEGCNASMAVRVPEDADENRDVPLCTINLDRSIFEGAPWPTDPWAAFAVLLFIRRMRTWYWRRLSRSQRRTMMPGPVTIVFPASENTYLDDKVMLQCIPRGRHRNATSGWPFTKSVLAHEYGHHLFDAGASNNPTPERPHHWTTASNPNQTPSLRHDRMSDETYEQMRLDFSEGYATFIAFCYLGRPVYRSYAVTGEQTSPHVSRSSRNCESRPGGAGFGDGPTASFLWDLVDGTNAADRDEVNLTFPQVHGHFAGYCRTRRGQNVSLPGFYMYLRGQSGMNSKHLRTLLEQNRLDAVLSAWRELRRTHVIR